jgi:GTP-binding protein HflX
VLERLLRDVPGAVLVSTRTGEGLGELIEVLARRVPRPDVEVHAVVPYTRGDLVARMHEIGEVLEQEHLAEGTQLRARVPAPLAAELAAYAPAPATT